MLVLAAPSRLQYRLRLEGAAPRGHRSTLGLCYSFTVFNIYLLILSSTTPTFDMMWLPNGFLMADLMNPAHI